METHSNSSRTRPIPMARSTIGSGDSPGYRKAVRRPARSLIGQAKVEAHGNKIEIAYRARVPTKDGKTYDLHFQGNLCVHAVRDG